MIDLLGRLRGGLDPKRREPTCWSASTSTRRKKGRAYSKGNRQKVALIAALASDVELLLLDEPTSGLDPLMEDDVPRGHRARSATQRPHRAAVQPHPGRGRGALRPGHHHPRRPDRGDRHPGRAAPPDPDRRSHAELAGPADGLAELPGVHDLQARTAGSSFEVDTDALDAVLRQLTEVGVRSLVSQPPTLEELFLRHYDTPTPGSALTDAGALPSRVRR